MGNRVWRVQVDQELVNELTAEAPVTDREMLQLDKSFEMHANLRQAPATSLAKLFARESQRACVGVSLALHQLAFKWFAGDFETKSGSVLKFVEPFLPEKDRRAAAKGFKIKYTDYDWSLNDKSQKKAP